ncbi:MAG TPA: hypothetical protein VJN01_07690, partial [Xanthomonadales bacterium]|nr:hypothetical protein [Xanthomonadales bacterium]
MFLRKIRNILIDLALDKVGWKAMLTVGGKWPQLKRPDMGRLGRTIRPIVIPGLRSKLWNPVTAGTLDS